MQGGKTMNRTGPRAGKSAAVVALLGSMLCFCAAVGVLGLVAWYRWLSPANPTVSAAVTPIVTPLPLSTPTLTPLFHATPAGEAVPEPTPTLAPRVTPLASLSGPSDTEARLQAAVLPQRDIRLLAQRLARTGPIPLVVHQQPPVYVLGEESTFWVGNMDTFDQTKITAVLEHITPHLYVWVDQDVSFDRQALIRSSEAFEANIYPTTRELFGSEWSPGIDGDPRLHILNTSNAAAGQMAAGYYSSADEYSRLANPYSNEREMFYVVLGGAMVPGSEWYEGVLAHEFQHMIHWASDRNEDAWVNEGLAELSAYLNGYDPGGFDELFLAAPDVQLTTWPDLQDASRHYGNSYLFMLYFWGRFGEDAVKELVAHPANGIAGFDAVLEARGWTFEEVFADWLIANYADS
jgi:hypothetical protein